MTGSLDLERNVLSWLSSGCRNEKLQIKLLDGINDHSAFHRPCCPPPPPPSPLTPPPSACDLHVHNHLCSADRQGMHVARWMTGYIDLREYQLQVDNDLRAAESNNKPSSPKATQGYLQRAFGDRLEDVEGVFKELAESFSPEDAADSGYRLYEKFRPSVPQGQRGWGAKGVLDLQYVLSLSGSQ